MVGGRSGELGVTAVVTAVSGWVIRSACAAGRVLVLEKWELLGYPLTRRAAGQPLPLVGQVGLVEVAAGDRGLSQARRPAGAQELPGLAETENPGQGLGRQAELSVRELAEMAAAQPDLARDAGHGG